MEFEESRLSGGSLNRRYKRSHLFTLTDLNPTQRHGEHNDQREGDPHFHFRLAANRVIFETEHLVEAAVDFASLCRSI